MNKRGVVSDYLPWILIALAVLAIVVLASIFMKDQVYALGDKLKSLFRI